MALFNVLPLVAFTLKGQPINIPDIFMTKEALEQTEFYLQHGLIYHFNGLWPGLVDYTNGFL